MSVKVENLTTKPVLDKDLQIVVEFMENNLAYYKLRWVANHLPKLAELLWGHHEDPPQNTRFHPLRLESTAFDEAIAEFEKSRGNVGHDK
jgi:hypothetical protein